jgi:hypothetical protein
MIKVERSLPSTNISSWLNYSNQTSAKTLPTEGLVLHLDSFNTSSYPGSGTIWYDISGQSNNYNIVSTAFQTSGNIKFMNFSGSHGCAKNSSDVNYASTGNATLVIFTQILNSTSNWRTLVRSYVGDHQVIVQANSNTLGMYDNDSNQFLSAGVDVTNASTRNLSTSWNMIMFKMSNSSPFYQVFVNNNTNAIGSITNNSATFTRGWGSIGAFHEGNTTPSSASQYWGNISVFMTYNRHISSNEQVSIYNNYSGIHGL